MGESVFLETERLILRRFTEEDAEDLFQLDGDPEVMRYLSGGEPTPMAEIRTQILPRFLSFYERYESFGYWAAIEKPTGEFLGWLSFHPTESGAAGAIELGYRLRRAAWGKGYATEGCRAVIRKGFIESGVERVTATTYEENIASRRVMEKSGLTLVRTYRITPEEIQSKGTFHASSQEVWDGDDVEYALTKDEWEKQEAWRGISGSG